MTLEFADKYLIDCMESLKVGDSRTAYSILKEAVSLLEAPIAWTGAGKDYKSKIGDFLKKKARDTVGVNGQARKDAQHAYQHGQHTLAHTAKLTKDADKFANSADKDKRAADMVAKKGDTAKADMFKQRAAGNAEKAVQAHNQGVTSHQAAMTGFKRTMDRANKEGDRETSDWAATPGAIHTNQRAFHMKKGSDIRKWASGLLRPAQSGGAAKQSAPAAQASHTPQARSQAPVAKDGQTDLQKADKAHAAQTSTAYKDQLAKVAKTRVSSTIGKPAQASRKLRAQSLKIPKSDTR